MRRSEITAGAEAYYAPGQFWRSVPPTKATIVENRPYRIIRRRQGPFTFVSHVPDPNGNAILVDLEEGAKVRRCAVPARDLRGLWLPTLKATGRTLAGVKAHDAALHDLATSGRPVDGAALLRLAAMDEGVTHDTLVMLAEHVDG